MNLTIGITYDIKTDWDVEESRPSDDNAEFDKPKTIDKIVAALESGGHIVKRIGNVNRLMEQINDLGVDIVFNLCEGRSGRNRESQVPILLEMNGIPFVGGDALTLGLTLDKILAKKIFIAEEIPTARFFQAETVDDARKAEGLNFPFIVKTRHEGSSKGIGEGARVTNMEELRKRIEYVISHYNQPALVEEFISGTEFTVPVLGNGEDIKAMPVVQVCMDGSVDLGDKFYTFTRIASTSLTYVCPAKISGELAQKMQDLAVRVFKAVDCRDLGRVDFRVDHDGNLYVLEINPLPSFDEEDVFNIFPNTYGSNYDEVLNEIIGHAVKRYGLRTPSLVTRDS